MITGKHITKIVALLMTVCVALCLCAVMLGEKIAAAYGAGVNMEYESKLFKSGRIIDVNIIMDSEAWQSMLSNAIKEEYASCDVQINGKTFYRVGIRTKGNTSLSSIANDPNTDRYSFKLEFDKYIDGQTCYGLDKLILNNNYADATNMKEALIYDLFAYVGADASLYNYACVSVNGEYWGVYLALEAVEESFLLRNYGTSSSGNLYKPDSMDMGGGNKNENRVENPFGGNRDKPDASSLPDFDFSKMNFQGGGMGGFGGMGGNGGANLNYIDDEPDSYYAIRDGAVTNSSEADLKRVIEALKNISTGESLEKYMDIDNLLKYAAVHIFSVNSDSLSGSMAHNYYLYENGGRLNLIPWDYNLAFGGMGRGGNANDTVNSPIDDAWNSTSFFDNLLKNEEYISLYYSYLRNVAEYVQNGGFDAFLTRVRSMIDELVKTDPTAFYSYDEYLSALETLKSFAALRAEAVLKQLDAKNTSAQSEQRTNDTKVDASGVNLNDMGSMNMGGGFANGRNNDRTQPMQNFGGFGGFNFDKPQDGEAQTEQVRVNARNSRTDKGAINQSNGVPRTLITYAVCVIIMAAAFLFVLLYRRKPRKR